MGVMTEKAEPRMVEVTSVPVIYVDDFARIVIEAGNVRVTFIEYRTLGTERVKMPVLEIVRPLASCRPDRFHNLMQMALGMPGAGSRH